MLHTEKIASKLEQLSIQFDMEGADNEESFFFVKEGVHFQVYYADGSYVFEASIKVEEFGFSELKEIATREMKSLRSLDKFINENVVNGMEKLAELNEEEIEEIEEIETTVSNEEKANEIRLNLQTKDCYTIAFNGIRLGHTLNEVLDSLHVKRTAFANGYDYNQMLKDIRYVYVVLDKYFTKEERELIYVKIRNLDNSKVHELLSFNLIDISGKELYFEECRYIRGEKVYQTTILLPQDGEVMVNTLVHSIEELESKQETITNEHGVTTTKEELEQLEQDTQKAIKTHNHFKMKEHAKSLVEYSYTIEINGIEHYINSDFIVDIANREGYNLEDFVYQIVLAYNEISPIVTPVASKVEIEETEQEGNEVINEIFNKVADLYNQVAVMDTNHLKIYHNHYEIDIHTTLWNIQVYYNEERGESGVMNFIEVYEVTDFIDQKLS